MKQKKREVLAYGYATKLVPLLGKNRQYWNAVRIQYPMIFLEIVSAYDKHMVKWQEEALKKFHKYLDIPVFSQSYSKKREEIEE